MAQPILKVDKLTKIFTRKGQPDFTAVDHVGFELYPGECLGLIGESGSGKTTVVNMITRLLDATEGSIVLDGEDITKLSGRELRRAYAKMQMVFQTPADSFDPRRTLGDGICESLRNKGVPKAEREAKARSLLEQCGLPGEFLERYPHQVSGGQCQRAAIARALMCDPRVLIFDEATSALDNVTQNKIQQAIDNMREGRTVIVIAHRLSTIVGADRIFFMQNGRILAEGSHAELLETCEPYRLLYQEEASAAG